MARSMHEKRLRVLAHWTKVLRGGMPSLSGPEVKVLALWSLGIVLAHRCSLHAVVLALALWLPAKPLSLRRRLQEWYTEAAAKKGHGAHARGLHRRDWDPAEVCPDLLAWMLRDWPTRQIVLALDPTNLGERFTVLNISLLYRGCAVPVLWTVVEGGKPEAWEPHWERMLEALNRQMPAGWQILVLTDRGMYSPRLFACLVRLHWHPFLRIRAQGFYRSNSSQNWLELNQLCPEPGQTVALAAEVFKNTEGRLDCTLLAYQGEGHAEPWLIVTDLSAELAQASWYGLRGWIEQGYKRIKGEGWRLPHTRITDPKRLERMWLAVAVATLWVLEVGGEAEEVDAFRPRQEPKQVGEATPALPDLETRPAPSVEEPEAGTKKPKRIWSIFRVGLQKLCLLLAAGSLVLGSWQPEPWPNHPQQPLPATIGPCAAQMASAEPQPTLQATAIGSVQGCHTDDSS